jgi:hypothetical protein
MDMAYTSTIVRNDLGFAFYHIVLENLLLICTALHTTVSPRSGDSSGVLRRASGGDGTPAAAPQEKIWGFLGVIGGSQTTLS